MKIFFDFFPLLIFFLGFKYGEKITLSLTGQQYSAIIVATILGIVATIIQISYHYFKNKKLEFIHIINLLVITIFGGLTIYLNDERFIKAKPTILFGFFALITFLSTKFFDKNPFVKKLLSEQIKLPETEWLKFNRNIGFFYLFISLLNIIVAYFTTMDTWVTFKVFGLTILNIIYFIWQFYMLRKYLVEPSKIR